MIAIQLQAIKQYYYKKGVYFLMTKINIKQLLEKEAKLNLTSTETLNKYY